MQWKTEIKNKLIVKAILKAAHTNIVEIVSESSISVLGQIPSSGIHFLSQKSGAEHKHQFHVTALRPHPSTRKLLIQPHTKSYHLYKSLFALKNATSSKKTNRHSPQSNLACLSLRKVFSLAKS
jgi:hypothetical protein